MKVREETFTRPTKGGRRIIYVRAVDVETTSVILTRSTGTDKKYEARDFIRALFASGEVERAARAKREGTSEEEAEADRLRALPLAAFLALFWSGDSPYLRAQADAGASLSRVYVDNSARAIERFVKVHEPFARVRLRDASLFLIERFVKAERKAGRTPGQVNRALDAMRTPLSWATKRGLVDSPFDFAGIARPKAERRARGILTEAELVAIVSLPVEDETTPRPRRKKGEPQTPPATLDKRTKAALLLAFLAGLRRGEARALRWKDVDLEAGTITVRGNYVRLDGEKAPKYGSAGLVPISDDLRGALVSLLALCEFLGRAAPDDFVLPNEERGKPIAEETLKRGFSRALRAIGIDEEEQAARGLVFHGGRHFFATKLADAIGPRAAARMTRHRSAAAFEGYADHTRPEAIEEARQALRLAGLPGAVPPSPTA